VRMRLGQTVCVTLFGESHGNSVGSLVEGVPAGTIIDAEILMEDMIARRPGSKLASKRKETDEVEILSGVYQGKATGDPILLLIRNRDARSTDYEFLPNQPRPGHADHVSHVKSQGYADPRGGGSFSGRLTAGLVAAGSISRLILPSEWKVEAKIHQIGGLDESEGRILAENCRKEKDSIGSSVILEISGLPVGIGEPWFDGLEPALAGALMAIPGARAVEFGRGVMAGTMKGSEHNDLWLDDFKLLEGADGALGGISTGAKLTVTITFKPPSSIAQPQQTWNEGLKEIRELIVKGRHDPVLAPRARMVVEAVARLVLADLGVRGGYIDA
jgi:chorismate synthase